MRLAATLAVSAAAGLGTVASAEASTLTLRPAAAPAGARVVVNGSGFRPGARVPLRLVGRTLTFVRVESSGRFASSVRVPVGLRPRSRFLTARSGGLRISAQLRILERPPTTPAPTEIATQTGFRLRVSRALARPGETVAVTGGGVRRGALISLGLADPIRVRASRNGSFRARFTIPQQARAGARASVSARVGRTTLRLAIDLAPPGTTVAAPPLLRADPLMVAAGDIACRPGQPVVELACHHAATANLAAGANADVVAPLGDVQYDRTTAAELVAFDSTWGRLKPRLRPAVGNHEYMTPGATPYYQYFGSVAGDPARGYYSYELGNWHVVVLNSNCAMVSCSPGSDQERWLRADLTAHPAPCTLAYWHHPRWTSGRVSGGDESVSGLWNALYDHGVDVNLVGHEHFYERITPLDDQGEPDAARGVRQFIVGTGGRGFSPYRSTAPGREAANARTFGVLLLSLKARSYSWFFAPETPGGFTDSGGEGCR